MSKDDINGAQKLTLVETKGNDLFSLNWPSPPRNILLLTKAYSEPAIEALVEFAKSVARFQDCRSSD